MIYAEHEVKVDRPALVFSSPSVTSSWESGPGTQDGCFCLFTQAFIEAKEQHEGALQDFLLFKTGSSHIAFLNEAQLTCVSALMRKMMEEMNSEYPGKYDLLRNYLRILMHEGLKKASSTSYGKNSGASARITSLFLDLLERQFPIDSPEQPLKLTTARHYANVLGIHTNQLNRAVKSVSGKTTTIHIIDRVVKEALALLKHTDWSISQIANSLGFDDPAYFANFFKKHNGYFPVNIRQNMIK